jgi:hypothetical protein
MVKNKNFLGGAARDTATYKGSDLLAIVRDTINIIARFHCRVTLSIPDAIARSHLHTSTAPQNQIKL